VSHARHEMLRSTEWWDDYFTTHGIEDWVMSAQAAAEVFQEYCSSAPYGSSVLVVGCGSSELPMLLHQQGFRVTAVDISEVVIRDMAQHEGPTWLVADVTDLPFNSNAFDVVLDKGTSDTLFFRVKRRFRCALVSSMWREVMRVLGPHGLYVNVTPRKAVPWQREVFLEACWEYQMEKVNEFQQKVIEECGKLEDQATGRKKKDAVYVHIFQRL